MSKLQTLYDLLRDETKWPDGFKWDYALNTKCALGLAVDTGLISGDEMFRPAAFGLDQIEWERIFHQPMGSPYRESGYTKVKPSTVALRIKRQLKAMADGE